jgi:predicted Zn-dependent protease
MTHKLSRLFVILMVLCAGSTPRIVQSAPAGSSYYIDLTEFRWVSFPLKVYVDMNEWSISDYAVSVQEALDNWVRSIWNYTQTYKDTSLPIVSYLLYLSKVNATADYDVYLTFTADTIPPGSKTVGLTNCDWNSTTFEPNPPINITVTTFSRNATSLYVKNVVMHEFGHALGLGHVSQANTSNGPELMYYASSKNQTIYPSTLDVYGLTRLYAGEFDHIVQLPDYIPYIMLTEGAIPNGQGSQQDLGQYLPILVAVSAVIIVAATLILFGKKKKHEEATPQPPVPQSTNTQNCLRVMSSAYRDA